MRSLAFIILVLFVSGCVVLRDSNIEKDNFTKLNSKNCKELEGEYLNYPDTAIGEFNDYPYGEQFSPLSLWEQIDRYDSYNPKEREEKQSVKFNIISNHIIRIELLENDSIIKISEIKGRFRNGYFYKRPPIIPIPIIPLLFGYYLEGYRIGLYKESIILDYEIHYWVCSLFGGEASNRICSSKFTKK